MNYLVLNYAGLTVFMAGAAYQDLSMRVVRNLWNLVWFAFFVGIHAMGHRLLETLLGVGGMLVVLVLPTLKRQWGAGDLKIGIVLGAAVGFLPAVAIYSIGYLLAHVSFVKRFTYAVGLRLGLENDQARLLPLATSMLIPVCCATAIGFKSHNLRGAIYTCPRTFKP